MNGYGFWRRPYYFPRWYEGGFYAIGEFLQNLARLRQLQEEQQRQQALKNLQFLSDLLTAQEISPMGVLFRTPTGRALMEQAGYGEILPEESIVSLPAQAVEFRPEGIKPEMPGYAMALPERLPLVHEEIERQRAAQAYRRALERLQRLQDIYEETRARERARQEMRKEPEKVYPKGYKEWLINYIGKETWEKMTPEQQRQAMEDYLSEYNIQTRPLKVFQFPKGN